MKSLSYSKAMGAVGSNVKRKDGIGKASGRTKYADDVTFPGMIYGRTIRSTIAAGRVKDVRHEYDAKGFTVVDHRDIPNGGKNLVALIVDDQPALVEREVRHVAEPVVLLAHANRETLEAARVTIDYEQLQTPRSARGDNGGAIFDPLKSDKVLKEFLIEKGSLDAGFKKA